MELTLYDYFRSSAAYRTRIGINLKGLKVKQSAVHLLKGGGEQFSSAFVELNPLRLVPVLEDNDATISQSLAILEYLEERYPEPPLLPPAPQDRAWVRQLALNIACDIHPLNNLRVLKFLTGELGLSDAQKSRWISHWITSGFIAIETELNKAGSRHGAFCFGDRPTIADCCLVPQVFNAQRYGVDLSPFPAILSVNAHCLEQPAFQAAHPSRQSDAE